MKAKFNIYAMKAHKIFNCFVLTILTSLFFSCNKESNGCYDAKFHAEHKDDICNASCPGVIGCDGNFYCNECEANRQGIVVE